MASGWVLGPSKSTVYSRQPCVSLYQPPWEVPFRPGWAHWFYLECGLLWLSASQISKDLQAQWEKPPHFCIITEENELKILASLRKSQTLLQKKLFDLWNTEAWLNFGRISYQLASPFLKVCQAIFFWLPWGKEKLNKLIFLAQYSNFRRLFGILKLFRDRRNF